MWSNRSLIKGLGVWLFALVLLPGCSGHTVRTGANSGEEDMEQVAGNQGGSGKGMVGQPTGPNGLPGENGHDSISSGEAETFPVSHGDRTATGGASAFSPSQSPYASGSGNGGSEFSEPDNGHNYASEDGSEPGSIGAPGLTKAIYPDPESMAHATRQRTNGTGQMSSEESSSPMSQVTSVGDPRTWADSYVKENGGPSPEYVNPDSNIAQADIAQADGQEIMIASNNMAVEENGSPSRMASSDGNIRDIYFAFDSWTITSQGAEFLEEGAQWLQANPQESLLIEGHCDQRGTQDYNLVLGKKRAEAARDYLVKLGVQPGRIQVVSYGKERPFCTYDSEDCFQENRRGHMVLRVN